MIKILYDDSVAKEEWAWYTEYITKKMQKSLRTQNLNTKKSKYLQRKVRLWLQKTVDDADKIADILLLPLEKLRAKYKLIEIYCRLAKKSESNVIAAKLLKSINKEISFLFEYKKIGKKMRWRIAEQMDVKVCPYCNRQYIHAMKDIGYLGDIDHILDKDTYRLFSLSIWNMLSCCKPCNQKFKHMSKKDILSPREAGFDSDCILQVKAKDTAAILGESDNFTLNWEILPKTPEYKKNKIQENIKLFQLDKQYRFHKDDIKRLLKLKRVYAKGYRDDLNAMLKITDEREFNRLVYGSSLDPKYFRDELLSKMIYDVVKNN